MSRLFLDENTRMRTELEKSKTALERSASEAGAAEEARAAQQQQIVRDKEHQIQKLK